MSAEVGNIRLRMGRGEFFVTPPVPCSIRLPPQLQSAVAGDARKIIVGRQHRQAMANAELRQERIDRSDLDAGTTTTVPQLRRSDVILAIRHKQRHRGKSIQNLRAGARSGKALQQLLEHEARGQQRIAGFDRANQHPQCRGLRRGVTPQRQRPNAGIDEQAQSRARSVL